MRQILQLERSIYKQKVRLKIQTMNNLSMEFTKMKIQSDWNQRLVSLERELIEARMEQENLRRINKSLQNTIKTATRNQEKDFYANQKLSMDMTWKQKYEKQVQRNLQSQKYIKLLQKKKPSKKPLSLAPHRSSSQQKSSSSSSSGNRLRSNYSTAVKTLFNNQHYYEPNTNKCNRNVTMFTENNLTRQVLSRNSSISKMDNFINNLLNKEQSGRVEEQVDLRLWENRDMGLIENKNYSNGRGAGGEKRDSMDQKFFSVKAGTIVRRQQLFENDENAWEQLIDRKMNMKCNLNTANSKPVFFKTQHDKAQRQRLQLSTHYR